jgi:hypothetical protein
MCFWIEAWEPVEGLQEFVWIYSGNAINKALLLTV